MIFSDYEKYIFKPTYNFLMLTDTMNINTNRLKVGFG